MQGCGTRVHLNIWPRNTQFWIGLAATRVECARMREEFQHRKAGSLAVFVGGLPPIEAAPHVGIAFELCVLQSLARHGHRVPLIVRQHLVTRARALAHNLPTSRSRVLTRTHSTTGSANLHRPRRPSFQSLKVDTTFAREMALRPSAAPARFPSSPRRRRTRAFRFGSRQQHAKICRPSDTRVRNVPHPCLNAGRSLGLTTIAFFLRLNLEHMHAETHSGGIWMRRLFPLSFVTCAKRRVLALAPLSPS